MLVFRMESERRTGPYRNNNGGNPKAMYGLDVCSSRHPTPTYDGIKGMEEIDICGFESLDKAIEWFDGVIEKLEEEGWHIAIYKTKKRFVKFGKKQVCFARNRAWLIGYVNKD